MNKGSGNKGSGPSVPPPKVYLNNVHLMVLENLAGECLQTRFARRDLPLREHLNSVHLN